MRSRKLGKRTSVPDAEVVSVSPHGIWIAVLEREFLLPFEQYPWFREATVGEIQHVQLLRDRHLRWPALDIDLEVESLIHPERYPLRYRR
jgi:hypothetical protein